jgi:hypothetical protein
MTGMKEDKTSSRAVLWVAIVTISFVAVWYAVIEYAESHRAPNQRPKMPDPWRQGSSIINP